MKILVTGAAGFIGSNLVDALIANNHQVIVIDNLSAGKKENLNPKAKFYQADIISPRVKEIFQKEKPEIVNHHAAQIDVRKSVKNPVYDAKINILGSLNLLEQCIKFGVQKFIFASSGGAIYGDAKILPTPENYLAKPLSPYGIAKLSLEYYLYYYKTVYGLSYISLRYGNVYGPRQDPFGEAGVVAIFTQAMLKNGKPIINGNGKQTRDYVYVADVVKANLLAVKYDKSGIFNVGTEKQTSVNEIFQKLTQITGFKGKEIHGPAKPGEQRTSCLNCQKIRKELGWEPKVRLNKGLKMTVEYFKKT